MSQQHADRPADPSSRRPPIPQYKLILLAGEVKDMMYVVRTIMELTRLCLAEATHKMWEAHHFGRSLVLVTHKERAELYVQQFSGRGLTVTIEET